MTILASNLVRGTLTRGPDGYRHTVVYLVTASGLKAALDATAVPHGTESSEIPGIYALDYSVETAEDQPNQFYVSVGYRRPEPTSTSDVEPPATPAGGTVQVGSRLQPATFTRDVNNAQIVTQHTYTETGKSGLVTQPAEVEGFTPTSVLTISRAEQDDPLSKSRTHVGTTNTGLFFGLPGGSWLCTAIEGTSEDNGATYQVTYEFEFSPQGWDATVVFINEETNRPVNGITQGVELQTYQIYARTNFANLSLE